MKIQRICQYCGKEFTAQRIFTQYCGDRCAKRAYSDRKRDEKIELSNNQTQRIRIKSTVDLNAKEFLTVREVSILLSCSIRTTYYYIKSGKIKAVNLSQRTTRIKRTDIDKLFN